MIINVVKLIINFFKKIGKCSFCHKKDELDLMNFEESNISNLIQLTGEQLIQQTLRKQNQFITINPSIINLKTAFIRNSQFGTEFTSKINNCSKEEFSTINNDKENNLYRKESILSFADSSPISINKKTKSAMQFNQIKNFSNALLQISANKNNTFLFNIFLKKNFL